MARKKTTVLLDEALYDLLRIRAAERRMSMSDVVEEALNRYLPKRGLESKSRIALPVASSGTRWPFPPHVDTDSATAMEEYLDELEAERIKAKGAA